MSRVYLLCRLLFFQCQLFESTVEPESRDLHHFHALQELLLLLSDSGHQWHLQSVNAHGLCSYRTFQGFLILINIKLLISYGVLVVCVT